MSKLGLCKVCKKIECNNNSHDKIEASLNLNIDRLTIDENNWHEDENEAMIQILDFFIGDSSGRYMFTNFFQNLFNLDDEEVLEYIDIDDKNYDYDYEFKFFDMVLEYFRDNGLDNFEAKNNILCDINYVDGGIALIAYKTIDE
jgi:hypothetical protein